MGIGFTIDSPAKVAHYGISSVISLVDDILVEKMRKFYCDKLSIPFDAIEKSVDDFRAKRITAYLDTINRVVQEKFEELKSTAFEKGSEITKYFDMLPDNSPLKASYKKMLSLTASTEKLELQNWLRDNMEPGSIDVNIMTKLDRKLYGKDGAVLDSKTWDAHAALRGFAKSSVEGTIVLSAGLNKKLYGYMAQLKEFLPNSDGSFSKKIAIKVSDYRSAETQGKFLAKKGVWVSEYRVESGLNCGGHAFATQGTLIGPILKEFCDSRDKLKEMVSNVYLKGCEKVGVVASKEPSFIVTAQGGVGNSEEQNLLLNSYGMDAIGWGSPFLLVPEVTNVDEHTINVLKNADEEDLYLSGISPLGVPFNNVYGNSKDIEKQQWIDAGTPGSTCPKRYLISNKEFSEKEICTASRLYQKKKLEELDESNLSDSDYQKAYQKIVEKACICVGLGTPALLINNLDRKIEGDAVSVCPGPNIAYYSEIKKLNEMCSHIYGREDIAVADKRPHMFIKELSMYVDHLKELVDDFSITLSERDIKTVTTFKDNIFDGINYYRTLADRSLSKSSSVVEKFLSDLSKWENAVKTTVAAVL